MTWEFFKKWLRDRKRIAEVCNKGTGNEVVTLWNGLMACEWQEPMQRINILWKSGHPRKIFQRVRIAEAKNPWDYPEMKEVLVKL